MKCTVPRCMGEEAEVSIWMHSVRLFAHWDSVAVVYVSVCTCM